MSKKPSRFVATLVASAIAAAFSTGAYDAFASTNNDQEFSAALTNGWELLRYDELDSGAIKESVISLSAENQGSALSGSINAVLTEDILGQVQAVENFAEFGTSSETVRSDFSGLFFDNSDASGSTFENASIAVSTESFAGGNTSVSGVQHNLGALTFTGSSTTISAESALTTSDSLASGDVSIVAGYYLNHDYSDQAVDSGNAPFSVAFAADQTSITAVDNGSSYGAFGLYAETAGTADPSIAFNGTADISAKSASGYAVGVALSEAGTGTLTFEQNATISAEGAQAYGLVVDGLQGEEGETSSPAVTFKGDANISAAGTGGTGCALWVGQGFFDENDAAITDVPVGMTSPAVLTFEGKSTLTGDVYLANGSRLVANGDFVVDGDFQSAANITGTGSLTINGTGAFYGSDFRGSDDVDIRLDNLTIDGQGGEFENTAAIEVADTITLKNVIFNNADNGETEGEVEAKNTIILGAGAVLNNYGHFDADNWVIQKDAKYLEYMGDGDFDEQGNVLHSSGRFELAGGLFGLIGDEDAMTGVIIRPDEDTINEIPAQFVVSSGNYDWQNITADREVVADTVALEVSGGTVETQNFVATKGNAAVTGGTFHAAQLTSNGSFEMAAEGGTFTVGTFTGAEGGSFRLASGEMQADVLDLSAGTLTIGDGSKLSTYSGQVFVNGLNAEGTNTDAGGLRYGDSLVFESGSTLAIRDNYFNDAYRQSASELFDQTVYLTFLGQLVGESGVVDSIAYEDVEAGQTLAQTSVTAAAGADGSFTTDKTFGAKTLAVEGGNALTVGEGTILTLVGAEDAVELVNFEDAGNGSITVLGGLQLGSAALEKTTSGMITSDVALNGATLHVVNGAFDLGTVTATNSTIAVENGYMLMENLTLDSNLTGTAVKGIYASGGTYTVKDGTINISVAGSDPSGSWREGMSAVGVHADAGSIISLGGSKNITATAANAESGYAAGIAITGESRVNLQTGTTVINANAASGSVAGILGDGTGQLTTDEGSVLTINLTGRDGFGFDMDGDTAIIAGDLNITADMTGDGSTAGIMADVSGTLTVDGSTVMTLSGSGVTGGVYGYGTADNKAALTFGNLSVTAASEKDGAFGIFADSFSDITVNGDLTVNVEGVNTEDWTVSAVKVEDAGTLTVKGKAELTASGTDARVLDIGNESGGAGTVSFLGGATLTGDAVIHAGSTLTMAGENTVSNGEFENAGTITVDGDLTLNGVAFNNKADGEGEVTGTIALGSGTTFYNYGHFDGTTWYLGEGSKYLEAYEEGDEEFQNGSMTLSSGRFVYAGGLFGLVTDENALRSWMVQADPEETATEDAPQLVVEAGDYDWDYVTVNTEDANVNAFEVSGGSVTLKAFNANLGRGAVSGGVLHADAVNAAGVFTMNAEGGTFTVGTFKGAEGASFTLASGTMQADALDLSSGLLTIAAGAGLSTYSDQVFLPGLNEEGNNPDVAGLLYGEDHLVFAEGSALTLRDNFYNADYLTSASTLLKDVDLTFTGQLVDASGDVQEAIDYDQVQEGQTLVQTGINAPAADETGTVTVDKTVGGQSLIVGEGATNVAVSEGKTLTLVGSADGGKLIDFAEEGETTVSVTGGIVLGRDGEAAPTKGEIDATVNLASGANLTSTNGEFTVAKVVAEGANIEAASGSLAVEDLTLSGETSVAAGTGASAALTTLTADVGTHQLKGDITAENVTGQGTILVGSAAEGESAAATFNVDTLAHSGIIFIDPAWVDGAEMQDGSFLTVQQLGEDGTLNAKVVAGQNSTFVFGSTKDKAVEAFAETGLQYGKDDITAVLYVAKPIAVGATGAILVDGSLASLGDTNPADGSVTIAANGLALIDASALSQDTAAVTAATVDIQKDAQVRIANLKGNLENSVLFEATEEGGLTVADDIAFESSDAMVDVSLETQGNKLVYSTVTNEAAQVFEGFEGSAIMQAVYDAQANSTNSTDRIVAFLSNMAAFGDHGLTKAQAVDIGNQAMALAATAGVYNVALDASKLMNRSVNDRMSIANGLVRGEGATVWADVLATRTSADTLYGDSGYSVDLYGGLLGVDVGLGNGKTVGAALTVGTGDGETEGAAFDVDNDADFIGLSVYGSHRIGDFNGKIDIGWMHTKSDLSATAFGVKIGDEVKADAWSIGLGGEYLFEVGSFNVVPHIGIRWTRLDVDGYEGAFKTDDDTMDVFTLPIGVAFSGNFNAGGWKLAPKVDLTVVPSFGDDEATSRVRWGNVSETVKTQVVDDAPFQATLGISAQNGNWTVGASYDLGVGGDDRLDNAFTLKAEFQF